MSVLQAIGQAPSALSLSSHQVAALHPQIQRREQGDQLRDVLLQPAVAHLHMTELALDDPEQMFDLGTHAGLEFLDLLDQGIDRVALPSARRLPGRIAMRQFTSALVSSLFGVPR